MPMLINAWRRLLQFGFRLLYREMAFTYDWVSWIVSLGAVALLATRYVGLPATSGQRSNFWS